MTGLPQLHILIVGGGIGGIALAQLLQGNKNVQCSVFDRDATAASRHNKWSVSLSTCLPVLGPKIGPRLGSFAKFSNTRDVGLADSAAILDWKTGEKRIGWGRDTPGPGYFIHANRQRVRDFFAPGVNVYWNKKFTRYEETASGVTAFFDDGTQYHGDILVGVDGANSKVRNQLLDGTTDLGCQPRPYAVIVGERKVDAAQHEALTSQSESFCMTMDNGSILHTGLNAPLLPATEHDYTKDKGPARYYYHLYIPDPAAATLDADNKTSDGTLFWTQTASAKELRERALDFTKHWKGPVRQIVELCQEEEMATPPFLLRDWCPPSGLVLPRGRVTLMGDAAHQMTPFRGIGANTAILDAIELAEAVDKATSEQGKLALDVLQATLDAYWAKILPRAREAVLTSRHAMERDPNGDLTAQMIGKAMSGGGPPPEMGGPPGAGRGGPPTEAGRGGPATGPPTGPPAGFDGTEADARRGLVWRG